MLATILALVCTLLIGPTMIGMATGPAAATPPLPTVDPTKHPRLAALLALVAKYGPAILSLLTSFGVKIPFPIPGVGQHGPTTAALAPQNHDALEKALDHVDLPALQAACKQLGC